MVSLTLPKIETGPFFFNRPQGWQETPARVKPKSTPPFGEWLNLVTPAYQWDWNYLAHIRQQLDRITTGEIDRLMLFVPPRHGKSSMVTVRYPVWRLERQPDLRVIVGAYNQTLVNRFSRQARRIAQSRLELDTERYAVEEWQTAAGGTFRAVGVGGGVTGQGGDLIIIDDPVKSRQEAESPTYRHAVEEWYTDDLFTRREPGAAIILIMTRWHEDDLAGRILASEDGPNWTVINLPAEAEADDVLGRPIGAALCPQRYDLEALAEIKKVLMPRNYNALYQQRPSAVEGAILKRHWWRFWQPRGQTLPPVRVRLADGELFECPVEDITVMEGQLQSWDMNFKDGNDNSFVVGQVWGWRGANRYLLDQTRGHFDFPATLQQVRRMSDAWPNTAAKLIEEKANGAAVIQSLRNEIPGIIGVQVDTSKEARVHGIAPTVESGNVLLPHPHIAPWVNDYLDEMTSFPNGAHDDQVDTTTQALNRLNAPRRRKSRSKEY